VLTEVDLALYATPTETDLVTFGIYRTTGGTPTGAALYSTTVVPAMLPSDSLIFTTPTQFKSLDVSGAAIPVSVGDVLALVLSSDGGSAPWTLWQSQSGNLYAGGTLFFSSNLGATWTPLGNDAAFRTLVNPVPEPGTLLLVGLGVGCTAWRRRNRSRRS
jgi:PEP-CTERM motif